jgi:hypothetical protein
MHTQVHPDGAITVSVDRTVKTSERQITRLGSVRLLADLLQDAEEEVTKLRTLLVKHHCTCACRVIDLLNADFHATDCTYRKLLS